MYYPTPTRDSPQWAPSKEDRNRDSLLSDSLFCFIKYFNERVVYPLSIANYWSCYLDFFHKFFLDASRLKKNTCVFSRPSYGGSVVCARVHGFDCPLRPGQFCLGKYQRYALIVNKIACILLFINIIFVLIKHKLIEWWVVVNGNLWIISCFSDAFSSIFHQIG